MAMEQFHELFPEIGGQEYRRLVILPNRPLPAGEYGFVEAYCMEEGCDCQNVLLTVQGHRAPHHEATINFAIDPEEFSREGLPRAFLDRANPQGPDAEKFLRLFEETLMRDSLYVDRLARHRAMVKELVNNRKRRGRNTLSRRR
jgi:hypothetical protein